MAGGIDWFRWHHGCVTDQKFPLVARKSGSSVAEVIAVWACLLEGASMNEAERGVLSGPPDFEALDCALGLPDGRAQSIFEALQQRALIDDQLQISAWNRRQPKRERTDESSTERSRAFRAMQRHATPEVDDATPCNAMQRQETPRVEKSRVDKEEEDSGAAAPARSAKASRPASSADFFGTDGEEIQPRAVVRLAKTWELPSEWGEDAERLGHDPPRILKESEKFRQYWVAGKGAGGRKSVRGWRQAWSNWLANSERYQR